MTPAGELVNTMPLTSGRPKALLNSALETGSSLRTGGIGKDRFDSCAGVL